MKKFVEPEVEIMEFNVEDVITESQPIVTDPDELPR